MCERGGGAVLFAEHLGLALMRTCGGEIIKWHVIDSLGAAEESWQLMVAWRG